MNNYSIELSNHSMRSSYLTRTVCWYNFRGYYTTHEIKYFTFPTKENVSTPYAFIFLKRNAHIEETLSFFSYLTFFFASLEIEKEKKRRQCFLTRDIRKTDSHATSPELNIFPFRCNNEIVKSLPINPVFWSFELVPLLSPLRSKVSLEKTATLFECNSNPLPSLRRVNLKIKVWNASLSRNKTPRDWKEKRMESVQTSSPPQRGRADYSWFVPWCVAIVERSR